jgi:hypothetical protein
VGTKAWTRLVLGVSTLGLIGYDIWVAQEPTDGDTISEVVNILSGEHPIIPYAWGALTAHLFSRKDWKSQAVKGNSRYVALGSSGIIVLVAGFFGILPDVGAAPWLMAGGLAGWTLWPQFDQNIDE